MCLVAFVAVSFILKVPKIEHSHWKIKLARIDFLGAFMLVVAVFTILVGLDHGSNVAWRSYWTLIPIGISVVFFILFILVEMNVATHPFAPGHVIFERTMTACYACNFFAFGGWMATIFYVPLYFQAVDGLSATAAGLRLIPGIMGSVSGSLSAGLLMQKTGKYFWLTIIAYGLLVVGQIPIILFSGVATNSTWGICIGMAICGFGGGIGVTTTLIAMISNADPADQAIATACSYLFRALGSVVGVSLAATVVQQSLRTHLRESLGGDDGRADEIVERVRQSLDYIKELDPEVRTIVRACYQRATSNAFTLTAVIVCGAAISAWFIKEKRLSR